MSTLSKITVMAAMASSSFAALLELSEVAHLRRRLDETEAARMCLAGFPPLNFTIVDGDAVAAAIEDDIRENLAVLGLQVNTIRVSKDDFNDLQTSGQYHLSFSESYGEPYDPHSYATSWIRGNGGEGHHQAFTNFDGEASREDLYTMIENVLEVEDRRLRQEAWENIHNYYHAQAVMFPLWGKRIPALINSRLTNYESGHQQFDYPVHRLIVVEGSREITIAPGGQTGLFTTVGRFDPHTYRPNEFFSNNWIYEGLVQYGEGGQVLPALAASWTVEDSDTTDGEKYTFNLRQNVTFHDGEPWNCDAAKLNFDHILAGDLKTEAWHGWHGVPLFLDSWVCEDEFVFVLTTTKKYYPLMQELTYIRPIRMLSPNSFAEGPSSDPNTANSCHVGWGTISSEENGDVTCAGITSPVGTGPLVFVSRTPGSIPDPTPEDPDNTREVDDEVLFTTNQDYWGGAPEYDSLRIVRYDSAEAVKAALLNEELDVVWGAGVLSDSDIAEIREDDSLQGKINVFYSEDIQNVVLLLNSGQPPLDDIEVRKIVIHAIDKATLIEKENVGDVVDNVFPRHLPNCDVDLTPRWDYDIQKATLLACAGDRAPDDNSDDTRILGIGLGVGLGVPVAVLALVALHFFNKSKQYEAELQKNTQAEAT